MWSKVSQGFHTTREVTAGGLWRAAALSLRGAPCGLKSAAPWAPGAFVADGSEWGVYLLPALGLILILYAVYQVIQETRSSARRRMQGRLRNRRRTEEDKSTATILRRGALSKSRSMAETVLGKLSFTARLQSLLDQADVDWSATQAILTLGGLSLAVGVSLCLAQVAAPVALGCGAGVMALPYVWLGLRRRRRQVKLCAQLPDVFEMMSQALRAGHSLAGAVQLIYEQMPPPIAKEFAQVYSEQNLGVRIEDAFQSMAKRVDSLDVKLFVTAVMIQRQTGGDLAEVLDNISGVIRQRIELAGLVRSLTAEGRLSGWVLFALPAIVFSATLYLNPNYAAILTDDPRGQLLLVVAGGMQLMGIAMIRWIVNIKV